MTSQILSSLILFAGLAVPQRVEPTAQAVKMNSAGVLLMKAHQFKDAADAFGRAVVAAPGFHVARVNLGIALFYSQKLDESMAVLHEALRRDDRDAYVHFCLGLVHKIKGDSEAAIDDFKQVTEIDPKCSAALYNLGALYAGRHEDGRAEPLLRRSLELEPSNAAALYGLGLLLVRSGRPDEGNALLQRSRSLRLRVEPASGMGGRGMEYGEMGRYAQVRDYPAR